MKSYLWNREKKIQKNLKILHVKNFYKKSAQECFFHKKIIIDKFSNNFILKQPKMSLLTFATSAAAFMLKLLDAADNLGWSTDDATSGYIEAVTASIISNGGAESDEMRAQLQERGIDVDAMMERMKAKGICKVLVGGQSTPLQWAVCSDDVAATTTCLALGAPPDSVGHGGPGCTMTPLVLAICLHNRSRGRGSNLSSIAPLLLAAGADPRQRTSRYFASESLV